MRTEGRQAAVVPIALSAAALLWPAMWNGYPLDLYSALVATG
jgi:hypothetical protein